MRGEGDRQASETESGKVWCAAQARAPGPPMAEAHALARPVEWWHPLAVARLASRNSLRKGFLEVDLALQERRLLVDGGGSAHRIRHGRRLLICARHALHPGVASLRTPKTRRSNVARRGHSRNEVREAGKAIACLAPNQRSTFVDFRSLNQVQCCEIIT